MDAQSADACMADEFAILVPDNLKNYTRFGIDNNGNLFGIDNAIFELKKTKKRELGEAYQANNIMNIVNGVSFTAVLQGEWFNTLLEKRKASALSRTDRLVYIMIDGYYTSDQSKTIKVFEGALPLNLVNIQDEKWDQVAMLNLRWYRYYQDKIEQAMTLEDLELDFIFEPVQTINMNEESQKYIDSDLCTESDKSFLLSKKEGNDFHIFAEIDPKKPLPYRDANA